MMRLILIRHGETQDNQKGKYCGSTGSGLSERGRIQALNLASMFDTYTISAIYSSDLSRAVDTAKLVFAGREITCDAAFREMDFGLFEGLTYDELMGLCPDEYRAWINDPMRCHAFQGESLQSVAKRVRSRLKELIRCHNDESVALVTHGGVINIILCDVLGYELNRFWDINQAHGTISVVDFSSDVTTKIFMDIDAQRLFVGHCLKEGEF